MKKNQKCNISYTKSYLLLNEILDTISSENKNKQNKSFFIIKKYKGFFSLLKEAGFFDADDEETDSGKSDTSDNDEDKDNKDEDDSSGGFFSDYEDSSDDNDDSNIDLESKLKMRILYSSMIKVRDILSQLLIVNRSEFEDIHNEFNKLLKHYEIFISYYSEFDESKRKRLLKLFRKAFIDINKRIIYKIKKHI